MIRVQAVARRQPLPTWIVSVVVSISLTVTCTTAEEIRFPEIEITANLALTAVSGEPSFGTGGDTVQRPGRQQHHSPLPILFAAAGRLVDSKIVAVEPTRTVADTAGMLRYRIDS